MSIHPLSIRAAVIAAVRDRMALVAATNPPHTKNHKKKQKKKHITRENRKNLEYPTLDDKLLLGLATRFPNRASRRPRSVWVHAPRSSTNRLCEDRYTIEKKQLTPEGCRPRAGALVFFRLVCVPVRGERKKEREILGGKGGEGKGLRHVRACLELREGGGPLAQVSLRWISFLYPFFHVLSHSTLMSCRSAFFSSSVIYACLCVF